MARRRGSSASARDEIPERLRTLTFDDWVDPAEVEPLRPDDGLPLVLAWVRWLARCRWHRAQLDWMRSRGLDPRRQYAVFGPEVGSRFRDREAFVTAVSRRLGLNGASGSPSTRH